MPKQSSCDFNMVPFGSAERDPCSPRFESFDPGIKGLLINAPGKVEAIKDPDRDSISEATRLPVCISMQFPLKYISKFQYPRASITLVMKNQKTGASFSSTLGYSEHMAPGREAKIPKDILETAMDRKYYSVNAAEYLRLPWQSGSYELYALFEEYRSNVLIVSITKR